MDLSFDTCLRANKCQLKLKNSLTIPFGSLEIRSDQKIGKITLFRMKFYKLNKNIRAQNRRLDNFRKLDGFLQYTLVGELL